MKNYFHFQKKNFLIIIFLILLLVSFFLIFNLIKSPNKEEVDVEKPIFEEHDGENLIYVPVGDSISNGAHATSENLRYINILASKIEQEFGYDVKIIDDFTIPGSGLKDNGIPNLQEIIELEPDFITLGFGTNDLSEEMLNAYSNPEEFETQLNFMLDTLIKEINDLKIVLVSTWRNGEDSEVYDNIIYEVGNQKAIQVVNISEVWENRVDTVGPKDVLTPYGISDSWHPNNLGHSLIAEKVYEKSYIILK